MKFRNQTQPLSTSSWICFVFLFLALANSAIAQDSTATNTIKSPLFAAETPIEFTLKLDVKAVKNDNSDDPQYSDGSLILKNPGAGTKEFSLKVKARGHARRVYDFCTFPPIKINFKKSEVKGTVFDGQDKLKLVSYCRDINDYEYLVLKEYLIYKIFNLITPNSFEVRLAQVTYQDINDSGKPITRYGFLIEDDEQMATRTGGKLTDVMLANHDRCERNSLDIFTIFEYMIGNTDWWMARPKTHNVLLVAMSNGNILPIPYDFDYSGLVGASYAVPDEKLGTKDVKERIFRGYCRFPGTYEKTAEIFMAKRQDIFSLVESFELLPEVQRKIMIKYLEAFYSDIENPQTFNTKINKACELDHDHLYKVKK
ncbi:MAG: hypothetical protein U5K79_12230 [Cyclobacteriaceae bacterium]|nr:hypothetical protein [Cyclobacteriaceae bacterium]